MNQTEIEKRKGFIGYAESFVYAVIGVVLLLTFVFRPVVVDGSSMLPTLHHGENIITVSVYGNLNYGDIVVLDSDVLGKNIVKRVIATEGQTVYIDRISGDVYVYDIEKGEALQEDYIKDKIDPQNICFGNLNYPYTVPKGHLFVMGDNRNGSTDSRTIGAVSRESIVGKVVLRITPFSAFGLVK